MSGSCGGDPTLGVHTVYCVACFKIYDSAWGCIRADILSGYFLQIGRAI